MADYWDSEDLVVSTSPIINWAKAGNTSVVSGYGVRCWTTDEVNQLVVRIAAQNSGWGIALKTVATTGDPVPILLKGLCKLTAGAAAAGGSTRDYQQTFGATGLLANASASTVHCGPIGWALQNIATGSEGLYYIHP